MPIGDIVNRSHRTVSESQRDGSLIIRHARPAFATDSSHVPATNRSLGKKTQQLDGLAHLSKLQTARPLNTPQIKIDALVPETNTTQGPPQENGAQEECQQLNRTKTHMPSMVFKTPSIASRTREASFSHRCALMKAFRFAQ